MKKIAVIVCILITSCVEHDINSNTTVCIDPEKWGPVTACPEYIDEVCGCDKITYVNPCFAKVAGVVSWTDGACN